MKAMKQALEIEKYRKLVAEMMLAEEYKEDEFRTDWILNHSWKAVPVEDGNHFTEVQIATMVSAFLNRGYSECVAVATEPLGDFPPCFRLQITPGDLHEFNRECGPFRYLLTEETRSWAISCNEWYNVFAGEHSVVEALLGTSIGEARSRFLAFAEHQARGNPEYPLLKAAQRYEQL